MQSITNLSQHEIYEKPKTDNTILKPQLKWINSIDNSYNPFIPLLTNKG
jgi:hypothetical protein